MIWTQSAIEVTKTQRSPETFQGAHGFCVRAGNVSQVFLPQIWGSEQQSTPLLRCSPRHNTKRVLSCMHPLGKHCWLLLNKLQCHPKIQSCFFVYPFCLVTNRSCLQNPTCLETNQGKFKTTPKPLYDFSFLWMLMSPELLFSFWVQFNQRSVFRKF